MARIKFRPQKDIPDLSGKVIFVTGGTSGLGSDAVATLAKNNPSHIFFTGRNARNAECLIAKIKSEIPLANITFLKCDHTYLASIKAAVDQFLSVSSRLDILICNAGIMALPPGTTIDDYEVQFAVNHVSHAYLIKLLLPTLLSTAAAATTTTSSQPNPDVRIVTVASEAYRHAPPQGIDFDTLHTPQEDLQSRITHGSRWSRYGQSKLANLLYAQELAKRHPEITSVSIHPGVVRTGLLEHLSFAAKLPTLIASTRRRTTLRHGPDNHLWAATCPKNQLINGEFYEPIGARGARSTPAAQDPHLAERLWQWTEAELEKYQEIVAKRMRIDSGIHSAKSSESLV